MIVLYSVLLVTILIIMYVLLQNKEKFIDIDRINTNIPQYNTCSELVNELYSVDYSKANLNILKPVAISSKNNTFKSGAHICALPKPNIQDFNIDENCKATLNVGDNTYEYQFDKIKQSESFNYEPQNFDCVLDVKNEEKVKTYIDFINKKNDESKNLAILKSTQENQLRQDNIKAAINETTDNNKLTTENIELRKQATANIMNAKSQIIVNTELTNRTQKMYENDLSTTNRLNTENSIAGNIIASVIGATGEKIPSYWEHIGSKSNWFVPGGEIFNWRDIIGSTQTKINNNDLTISFWLLTGRTFPEWRSLMRLTNDKGDIVSGSRIPGLFIFPESTRLHIIHDLVNGTNTDENVDGIAVGIPIFITLVFTDRILQVFMNGKLISRRIYPNEPVLADETFKFYIGDKYYKRDGLLFRDIKIWHGVLTANTIRQEYQKYGTTLNVDTRIHSSNRSLFSVRNVNGTNTNSCMTVQGRSFRMATPLDVWKCFGGDEQRWTYNNGTLRPQFNPSQCIDVTHGKSDRGTQLIQWGCHGGNNQLFYMDQQQKLHPYSSPDMCVTADPNIRSSPFFLEKCENSRGFTIFNR